MNNHSNISNSLNNTTTSTSPQDLGLHFLEMARLGLPRGLCDMDEDEDSPTELNTINSSGGFLLVTPDKLSVKYTNVNLHGHDVGVVQANKPAPVKRLVYYFEIHVKDAGAKGQIAIGFTTESFKMRRQPGLGYASLISFFISPFSLIAFIVSTISLSLGSGTNVTFIGID